MHRVTGVAAIQSTSDPGLWIFAIHDSSLTKMIGVDESARGVRNPPQVDQRYVEGSQPLDAASVTTLWKVGTKQGPNFEFGGRTYVVSDVDWG